MAGLINGAPTVGFTYTERSTVTPSPDDQDMSDSMRLIRELNIIPGTMAARYAAKKAFLGYPTLDSFPIGSAPGTVRWVKRTLPDIKTWTDFPNALIAVETRGRASVGVPDGAKPTYNVQYQINEYAQTVMTVEYRSTNYTVLPDSQCVAGGYFQTNFGLNLPDEGLMQRYISRFWRYAGHIVTIPVGFTGIGADTASMNADTFGAVPNKGGSPVRVPLIELTYIQHELPLGAVPTQTILATIGAMTSVYFDPFGWNVPPYCALYIGAEPRNYGKLITGEQGCSMEHKFLVAPNVVQYGPQAGVFGGWRRVLAPLPPLAGTGSGGKAVADYRELRVYYANTTLASSLGNFVIPVMDFTALFRPPQT